VAEAEPRPAVEQRGVVGRHRRVVAGQAALPPVGRDGGVQVAHRLGVGDRVTGALDEHVRPPDRLGPRHGDEVAGELAARERRD